VGYQYATNHLIAFAARFAASVEMQRKRTPKSDDFFYLPTIYPGDALLHLTPRVVA
jgi:hypothetical protein